MNDTQKTEDAKGPELRKVTTLSIEPLEPRTAPGVLVGDVAGVIYGDASAANDGVLVGD
jgi:hypothetical protein